MMLTTLTLLLLSAEPPAQPGPAVSAPSLAVVSTSAPGLEKVSAEAGRTLGARLEATYVDLGGYLKSRGPSCQEDARCLLAAPGLSGASRLLHLRLRPLAPGRLAVDLRLIDLTSRKALGRNASVVEQGELATWTERASGQLLTRVDPYAQKPPPSPFAVKPAPKPAPTEPQPKADAPTEGKPRSAPDAK
jgi:hypothetical protein